MGRPSSTGTVVNPAAPKRPFPRARRIRSSADFDAAFARGRRVSGNDALLVVKRNEGALTRLGISVGRKFGNSPERNRAKRLLREAFRLERPCLPEGFDLVIVPRRPGFPDSLVAVRAMLRRLIERGTGQKPKDPDVA